VKLAVIPARGGSKRIPRKNIKDFCGKPMIAWSIEVAQASGLFERIIVSTDDPEIADISRAWGAEVPFIRPAELSHDNAGAAPVIAHATQWCQEQGCAPDFVCCLLATAPFLQVDDLQKAWRNMEAGTWQYVFAATDFGYPIFRAIRETETGGVEMFFPQYAETRSQDLPLALHDAGQFYWGHARAWLAGLPVLAGHSKAVLIPRWRVQDIDTPEDWERASMIARALLSPGA
jgi:N-acylneuraminate cytidylyltransferase